MEGALEGDSTMDSLRLAQNKGVSAVCAIPSLPLLLLWLLTVVRLSTLRLLSKSTELPVQRNPAPPLFKTVP